MFRNSRYLLKITQKILTPSIIRIQIFHNENENKQCSNATTEVPGAIQEKYKIYKDEDSLEIFDVEEEKYQEDIDLSQPHQLENKEENINLARGLTGVYDIEDLVEVLEQENAENIFVCPVAKELNYVDYMCIVTGKSHRHMLAMAQYVRRIYKKKRGPNDILPKIEGENCDKWIAMDLGNIALHIFSEEAREKYDLETLWTLGPEFDKESNKLEYDLIELYKQHSNYIEDIANQSNNKEEKT